MEISTGETPTLPPSRTRGALVGPSDSPHTYRASDHVRLLYTAAWCLLSCLLAAVAMAVASLRVSSLSYARGLAIHASDAARLRAGRLESRLIARGGVRAGSECSWFTPGRWFGVQSSHSHPHSTWMQPCRHRPCRRRRPRRSSARSQHTRSRTRVTQVARGSTSADGG